MLLAKLQFMEVFTYFAGLAGATVEWQMEFVWWGTVKDIIISEEFIY